MNVKTTETHVTVGLNGPQYSWVLHNQLNIFTIELPKNILPIPKLKETEKINLRKRSKTEILTESLNKNEFQMSK